MSTLRVVGFGDSIIDRFVDRGVAYPGGNAVNVAVYAARLGLPASYVGVIGTDPEAEHLLSALADEGVDTSDCVVVDGPTGITDIRVDEGDRVFLGWNGGGVTISDPIRPGPEAVERLRAAAWVHTSTYSATEPVLPALAGGSAVVSMDFSSEAKYRTVDRLADTCPHLDLAMFSCGGMTDAATLELLTSAVGYGAGAALATRGRDDAMILVGGRVLTCPADLEATAGRVLDTMGCGDAFVAGFGVSLLRAGWTPSDIPVEAVPAALVAGARYAARQCLVEGAFGHGRPSLAPVD